MLPVSHAPDGYSCPFCRIQRGEYNDRNRPTDVIAVTDRAYARIAPKWWPGNPGAALAVPRRHLENLYTMPAEDGHAVWDLTQAVAVAMRDTYGCAGTSIRQHNEPAGNQDVWHLHVHVFPRHIEDRLYQRHDQARWVEASERARYAQQLRYALTLPVTFGSPTQEPASRVSRARAALAPEALAPARPPASSPPGARSSPRWTALGGFLRALTPGKRRPSSSG